MYTLFSCYLFIEKAVSEVLEFKQEKIESLGAAVKSEKRKRKNKGKRLSCN